MSLAAGHVAFRDLPATGDACEHGANPADWPKGHGSTGHCAECASVFYILTANYLRQIRIRNVYRSLPKIVFMLASGLAQWKKKGEWARSHE